MEPNLAETPDVDKWLIVRNRLLKGREDSERLSLPWHYPLPMPQDREQAASPWLVANRINNDSVLQICDRWLTHGIVDDLGDQLRWLFRVRFDPAIDFVEQIVWSRGFASGSPEWASIFPFPQMTTDQFVRSLLSDWWMQSGTNTFFDRYYDGGLLNYVVNPSNS